MNAGTSRIADNNTLRRLLATLERLMAIDATELTAVLNQAGQLIAEVLDAEKVDIFLHEPASNTLVALGTSDTPLAQFQRASGMDQLPVANRGRTVEVFQTGVAYFTGHADTDPDELIGIKEGLGVRSTIAVPLDVNGQRRGVMAVNATQPERFSQDDLRFLEAVSHWIGSLVHRSELVAQITQEAATQARHVAADELISVLAHDLRNYLTPLSGQIGLIRSRATREGRTRDLDTANAAMQAVERLRRLIADLLDTNRLEQGLFALVVQPLSMTALAQETASLLRTPTNDIQVRAAEDLRVQADPSRLRQALENLLNNAIRFSPPGASVIVTVEREVHADGVWVALSICDVGPGIVADLVPRLFTRFARGPESTGLGLGLFLARGIVEAHGGTLTVESTPGVGTTFRLALPILSTPD